MNSHNDKTLLKNDEKMVNLISLLNNKELSVLLNEASNNLNLRTLINISTGEDYKEQYIILEKIAEIAEYLDQINKYVVMDFLDYVLIKNSYESHETSQSPESEQSTESSESRNFSQRLMNLVALQFMHKLHQTNPKLYEQLAQPKESHDEVIFDVCFMPVILDKMQQVTYQFLFDQWSKTWRLLRLSPEFKNSEVVTNEYLLGRINTILTQEKVDTKNPFIRKSLISILKHHEEKFQSSQRKNKIDQLFQDNYFKYYPKLIKLSEKTLSKLPEIDKIDIINTTYYHHINKNPEFMKKLLQNKKLFNLKKDFTLIATLAKHITQYEMIINFLNLPWIKEAFLNADVEDFLLLEQSMSFDYIYKIYLEEASEIQLAKLDKRILHKFILALSPVELEKYRNQGKLKLSHPQHGDKIMQLHETFPIQFPLILEDMILSGELIDDITQSEIIRKYYVNLLFKYEGQWLPLATHKTKNDLLILAMKMDAKKTLAIINKLSHSDHHGNTILPFVMNAETITKLITQSPDIACVLLDNTSVIQTLQHEKCSLQQYGDTRHFDLLHKILKITPVHYGEKLLISGILFPEKNMPHFHHLSFINENFRILHDHLETPYFLKALYDGLTNNPNVDRLFLKNIFTIDLLALAKLIRSFPGIKHLEIGLSLQKENQANIIQFFRRLEKTHPHLHFHLQVELTEEMKLFQFFARVLSQCNNNITSLSIIPENTRVKLKLLDRKKQAFKQDFDRCITAICQHNHHLHQISISGFSKSGLDNYDDHPGYIFKNLPIYNTNIYSVVDMAEVPLGEKDSHTEALLQRNKDIHALTHTLKILSHYQTILELLPWLALNGLPAEIILNIFDILATLQEMPSNVRKYRTALNAIKSYHFKSDEASGNEGIMESELSNEYYRQMPHKDTIHKFYQFMEMSALQNLVMTVITNWFGDKSHDVIPILQSYRNLNNEINANKKGVYRIKDLYDLYDLRSESRLMKVLDGIHSNDNSVSTIVFTKLLININCYHQSVKHLLTKMRREAYIAYQCEGPLYQPNAWKDLSTQSFDAMELLKTLEDYNPDKDHHKSYHNPLKKISPHVFYGFNESEKQLFKNIQKILKEYIRLQEQTRDQQGGKHKYKIELLRLMHAENIAIYEHSKPRLYLILNMQRERLTVSLSKCSTRLLLWKHGLFSSYHEKKLRDNAVAIKETENKIMQYMKK